MRGTTGLVILACVSVVAACGNSSKGASPAPTTAATASSGTAPRGEPIEIGVLGTIESTIVSYPEVKDAALATGKAINAAGGVGGRPVEIVICNDDFDPNIAATCAQNLVDQHVVAVIGPTSYVGNPEILAILQKANTAWVASAPLFPADRTSPVSFPVAGGEDISYATLGEGLAKAGCKKISSLGLNNADTQSLSKFISQGAKSAGADFVGADLIPAALPDYTANIAAMQAKGVDCVVNQGPEQMYLQELQTAQQAGNGMRVGVTMAVVTGAAFKASPSTTIFASTVVPPQASGNADIDRYNAEMDQYGGGSIRSANTVQVWGGIQVVVAAIRRVSGNVTPDNVLKAMSTFTTSPTTVFPPFNTTKPGPVAGLPRFFGTTGTIYKRDGNNLSTVATFNVAGALAAAVAAAG
jgi:ABC-type branched-subunit amino acid transport system substrate-binding protein